MTSEGFVHVWLPGRVEPVVCGRAFEVEGELHFVYGRSYLARPTAIPLDPRELRLSEEVHRPRRDRVHGVLRDASPDSWGRRVIESRRGTGALSEIEYLLSAGRDRVGALAVAEETVLPAEDEAGVALDALLEAARRVELGLPLPPSLELALLHASSLGGARPKALLDSGDRRWIAKFASTSDTYPVVRAEFAAMQLARDVGLFVPETQLVQSLGKDVLLVERFDRVPVGAAWGRRMLVSALTALQLAESEARLASYLDLAGFLRKSARAAGADCRELYRRMVFNLLIGNTDDHARNHAFFWDGEAYELTPAYDLCPMLRSGRTAAQAMIVGREGRRSSLSNARSEAGRFGLDEVEAGDLIEALVAESRARWPDAAERAGLTAADRARLERETVLGPGCFE